MRTSAQGLDLIMQSEGFRATVYKDVAGIPTIGYGHRILLGESFPARLTQPEAQALLARDVGAAEEAVSILVKVPLTQSQFDALVDFVFNLGSGRLASSTLLRELNAGNYTAAAAQILLWNRAGGRENSGLKAAGRPSSASLLPARLRNPPQSQLSRSPNLFPVPLKPTHREPPPNRTTA